MRFSDFLQRSCLRPQFGTGLLENRASRRPETYFRFQRVFLPNKDSIPYEARQKTSLRQVPPAGKALNLDRHTVRLNERLRHSLLSSTQSDTATVKINPVKLKSGFW